MRLLLRAIQQRRSRPLWQWILFGSLLLLAAVFLTVSDDGRVDFSRLTQPAALEPLALVVIVLPLALAAIRLLFHYVVYPLMFRRSGQAGAQLTYVIGDTSIEWTGPSASGVIQWPAICAVTKLAEGDGIVLWTGPRAGILLPREAFGSDDDMVKVEDLANARLTAADQTG
jgi:hypothetical protein